jgi:hypothetical protein
MRAAFHLIDLSKPKDKQHYVCKMSKDPKEDTSTYFMDVEMQALAKLFADEFNKFNPPKKVDFVEASLIKCLERRGQPILAVEPFLKGKYVKHSNNYGFVSEEDRNTPQAFSHFSYCKSKGDLLICDIQGVDDKYTDPQIHSKDKTGFGKGNMGISGMHKFFETHRCNSICRLIGLPPHQTKQVDYGTVVPSFNAGRALSGGQLQMHPRKSSGAPVSPGVVPLLSADQEVQIKRAFSLFDKDQRGYIDADGFYNVCKVLGFKMSPYEAREKMAQICGRPSEYLDYRHFINWWATGQCAR